MNESEWLQSESPRDMLGLMRSRKGSRFRRWVLFNIACCRRLGSLSHESIVNNPRVLASIETIEHLLDIHPPRDWRVVHDRLRSRDPIIAYGEIADPDRSSLRDQLESPFSCIQQPTLPVANTGPVPYPKEIWALQSILAENHLTHVCAVEAISQMQGRGQRLAAKVGEERAQCAILRCIFGNPFRELAIDSSWLTWRGGAIPTLARAMYVERSFDRMGQLADLLAEAGCQDAAILEHCRGDAVHFRGCHVVDKILAAQRSHQTIDAYVTQTVEPELKSTSLRRAHLVYELSRIGLQSARTLPLVASALEDEDPGVRKAALRALSHFRSAALPHLSRALELADNDCRRQAVGRLTRLGRDAAPVLAKAARDQDFEIYKLAIKGLVNLGAVALDTLAGLLDDDREMVRVATVNALGELAKILFDAHGPNLRKWKYADVWLRLRLTNVVMTSMETALTDPSFWVRRAGAFALAQVGPAAAFAVPTLKTLTSDSEDEGVRRHAALALDKIGPPLEMIAAADEPSPWSDRWIAALTDSDSPHTLRTLVFDEMRAALHGDNRDLRENAIFAVIVVGMEAVDLREDLIRLWDSLSQSEIPRSLISALGRVRALPTLIHVLQSEDHARLWPRLVPRVLWPLGPAAAEAATALVQTLGDKVQRLEAVAALKAIGTAAVPSLLAALQQPNEWLRGRSIFVLGNIAPQDGAVVAAAVAALDDADDNVRRRAAYALSRLGPLPNDAISRLIQALTDSFEWVRIDAILALRNSPPPAEFAPALIASLDGANRELQVEILSVLAAMGPSARSVVPALERFCHSDTGVLRVAAARARWRVSGAVDGPLLRRAAVDSEPRTRKEAIAALGELGEAADLIVGAMADVNTEVRIAAAVVAFRYRSNPEIVAAVYRLLNDPDAEIRWRAIHSLLQLDETDSRISRAMLRTLRLEQHGASNFERGRECLDAIGLLGPRALPMICEIEKIRVERRELTAYAIVTLGKIRGDITSAVHGLILCFSDADANRESAAECLGALGPAATLAVPILTRAACFGSNPYYRVAALEAITRIDPATADRIRANFS